jgi:hypothetical protein
MKKVKFLERHLYAPELNKLWYNDNTYKKVPQCTTIEEAENHARLETAFITSYKYF